MIGSKLKRAVGANPFVGPRPFETGRKIFGRDREIDDLYYLLSAERIVLLHSPSGAGKSSLIQAGLIPRLNERFDVWGPTRVNLQPSADQSSSINRYVRSATLGFEQQIPAERRRSEAQLAAMTLAEYVASRPRRRSAPQNIVLIFDQFEEILTADPLAIEAKHEFFRQLGELLLDPHIWALFALREDYLAPLDPYADQVPTHLKNSFRLDLLRRDAARDAITGTAAEGGREADPAAVDKLVRDLATMKVQQPDGTFVKQTGLYVEPLQLQVVCRGLWERMPEDDLRIDLEDIEKFGDVTDALSNYYSGEVGRIAGEDVRVERAIREWCGDRLITPNGIRGQVLRGAGQSEGLDNELIASLVNTHLVRGEQRAGAVWYELAHDRLIEPVRNNNRDWLDAHLHKVQKVATLWEAQGRPEGLLLLGEELIEAKQWAEQNESSLATVESKFLEASTAKQEALEKEQRQAKRLRRLLVAVAAIALLALGAAGYALINFLESKYQQSIAQYQETNAVEKQSEAEKSAREAYLQKTLAGLQTTIAESQAQVAQQQTLAANNAKNEAEEQTQLAENSAYVAGINLAATEFSRGNTPRGVNLLTSFIPKDGNTDIRDFYWYYLWENNPKEKAIFNYDESEITVADSIAFSPDGKMLAKMVRGNIVAWDMEHEKQLRSPGFLDFYDHDFIIFSPDGQTLGSWGGDKLILWDVTKDKAIPKIGMPISVKGVISLAFSPDGNVLASGGGDSVRLWDVKSGKYLETLTGSTQDVNSVAFSPDGRLLALGGNDGVKLYERKTRTLKKLGGHTKSVRSVAFSPDGNVLVSGGGVEVKLWDVDKMEILTTLIGHTKDIKSVAFSPVAKMFASTDSVSVKVWDLETRREVTTLNGYTDDINSIAFSPNSLTLAIGLVGDLKLWNLEGIWNAKKKETLAIHNRHSMAVDSVAFSADGKILVSRSKSGAIKIWDVLSGTLLKQLDNERNQLFSKLPPVFSLDGKILSSSKLNGKAKIDKLLFGDTNPLYSSFAFSPDEKTLAFGYTGEGVEIWDVKSAESLAKFSLPTEVCIEGECPNNVHTLAFSPDGKVLAVGSGDYKVRIWDAMRRKVIATLDEPFLPRSVAFSPDGRVLAASGSEVKLWETKNWKELATLSGHTKGVSSIAFSTDGKTLASGGPDGIKLWNTRVGKELAELNWQSEGITSVAFSPDGKNFASGGEDGIVRLWTGASNKNVEAFWPRKKQ